MAFVTSLDRSKDAGARRRGAGGLGDCGRPFERTENTGCVIDMVETKGGFKSGGEITTPSDTKFMTKNEQGTVQYEERRVSARNGTKQARAAKYVVGKTAEEVKGIAVDGTGRATGLTQSPVTISIAGLSTPLSKRRKARRTWRDVRRQAGVGVETNILYSNDAGGESRQSRQQERKRPDLRYIRRSNDG